MSLSKGKLGLEQLERLVFPHLPRVEDSRAVVLDYTTTPAEGRLVVATDPVIGVPLQYYGFFAIHYSATDVAMATAKPQFLTLGVYYPPETPEAWLESTMQQLGQEAHQLQIQILGGHTGGYDGLTVPFISTTCIGILPPEKPEPPSVSVNDVLIAVGPVGRETLWFLANVEPSQIDAFMSRSRREEIAQDLTPFSLAPLIPLLPPKSIHLMHDLAEGGLALGVTEIAQATGLGIEIQYDAIPWDEAAYQFFEYLQWNPLNCSSFGSFLIATSQDSAEEIIHILSTQNRLAAIIGSFTKKRRVIIQRNDESKPLKPGQDPYQKFTDQIS